MNDAFWASLVFKGMIIKSNINVFIYAQQRRDDPHRTPIGSKRIGAVLSVEWGRSMEMVKVGEVEDVMTTEKMAEIAIKVLCAGMSVAMS